MKNKIFFISVILCLLPAINVMAQANEGRDMIYTYWHQLDGPYWIHKPASISIANQHIYSCGADNDGVDHVAVSTDGGNTWNKYQRAGYPANSISASINNPIHAYYTSLGNNVFSTFNAGSDWGAPTTPPSNLNFSCCAANPLNNQKALVGCGSSESSFDNLWKSVNHGADWSAISNVPERWEVDAAAWSQVDEDLFYIGFQGAENHCLYRYTNGGTDYEDITPPDMYIDQIRRISVIQNGENDDIIAIGYGPHYWQIAFSPDNGGHWEAIQLPSGFINMAEFTNQIHDAAIIKIENDLPVFLIATDIGIFEYGSGAEWTRIYDNPGDNDVYSVAFRASETNPEIYTGTMHSLLSIDSNNNFRRVNKAMFTADLKSVWACPGEQAAGYTINTKTGAIFRTHVDFSEFNYESDKIDIVTDEADCDTIVANISGTDGEYNGLDIAGFNHSADFVIASSKDQTGEGKLIRYYGGEWREIEIQGNPALTQLAVYDENGYGAAENGDFYASFNHGDNWNYVGRVNASHVYDLIAISTNELVISVAGNDEVQKIGYSSNGGQSWYYAPDEI